MNSYELTYHKESLFSQNPSIILRFNDSDGIMCESKAEKRMFDYQDFWDATGKDDISWVISI